MLSSVRNDFCNHLVLDPNSNQLKYVFWENANVTYENWQHSINNLACRYIAKRKRCNRNIPRKSNTPQIKETIRTK